jgi:DNA topoisomerase I
MPREGNNEPVPRLRRSDCHSPGISRRPRGRGFSYRWEASGEAVTDPEILVRIAKLVIPPAWEDVWICPWPHGHIQAVGTDKAGRRQYRYHDAWRVQRDREKFERILRFAQTLPRIRSTVERDLTADGIAESKVLAAAVRLLDLGFFRIGGEQYAEENETFGVATLLKNHVKLNKDEMIFDYPAKGSIRRTVTVADPTTLALIRVLKHRRGGSDKLFAYKDRGRWADIRSEDVNAYIRETAGGDFSAKDFRTWAATVLGAVELAGTLETGCSSKTARKKASAQAVKTVSEYLGNTPAVCRNSYIDPRILDRFDGGETIAPVLERLGDSPDITDRAIRERIESAVVDLIADESASAAAA